MGWQNRGDVVLWCCFHADDIVSPPPPPPLLALTIAKCIANERGEGRGGT